MNIQYTLIFILITSFISAQEKVEDYVKIQHTLDDFELNGNVKEMTVIHSGVDYRDNEEKQYGTVARTKYTFNKVGQLDSLIVFDRNSSIYNALVISYDNHGRIKKVMDSDGYNLNIKEIKFKYVNSSDSISSEDILSIAVNEKYSKYKLIYQYDKTGKLVNAINNCTEKDLKLKENARIINDFIKKYTYNKNGSLKQIKSIYNDKVNGTLDNIEYYEYDDRGTLTKSYKKQLEKDNWHQPEVITYNNQGKITHYYEGDSTVNDEIYSHNINYYNEDQILMGAYSHTLGDGEFEWFKKFEYSWDEYGNWIELKTYLKESAHHYKRDDESIKFRFDRRDKRQIIYYD